VHVGLSTDYAGLRLTGRERRTRPRLHPVGGTVYGGRSSRRHGYGYRRRPNPAARALRAGGALMLLLVLLAGCSGAAVDTMYANRALPAVRFETLPLGGLPADQARGVLQPSLSAYLASPAIFAWNDREWRPSAAEMGIAVDDAAMARDAVQLGRTGAWPLRYFGALATFATKPTVPLRVSLNPTQLAAFLHAVAAEVNREPVNAGLQIRNGQVVAGQAAPGRKVDIPDTAQRVTAPATLTQQRVEVVVVVESPVLSDAAVQDARAQAEHILAAPLTLRLGDKVWTLSPTQLGAMIEFQRAPATAAGVAAATPAAGTTAGASSERLVAVLNEARLAAYVKTLAAEADQPARDAQVRWTGSGATVIRAAADGIRVDQPAAVKLIASRAATDARDITLPATVTKPAVTGDEEMLGGIRQPIATGTSKFAGSSPERVNNIQVAASKLDGAVIPAGATFSFLKTLGPITREAGYQEGLTIQGDATVPGIGGGVCQVSTTVFRAAFFAGLPFVERHQHSYRVSYYEQDGSPVGFDAAVYDPGVDLRFRNDTGTAILMHAQVDRQASTLTFRFYGTDTGRDVKLTPQKANEIKAGPRLPDGTDATLPKGTRKQVEWSADGVDATIRRVVTRGPGGATLLSDSFFSRYVPWREKWVVGTG
jgi:vancomycin resistance protein YoaR